MTVLKTSMRNFFAHKGRMALSAVAVLLSVAFVCGTLVFTDTMNTTFDKLFAATSSDVTVSPKAAKSDNTPQNGRPDSLPASVLERAKKAQGVKYAEGAVSSMNVTVVNSANKNMGSSTGAPTIAGNWTRNDLRSMEITSGHAPRGPTETMVDADTADKHHLKLGDELRTIAVTGDFKARIVGIATFKVTNPGAAVVYFDTATAQRELLGTTGRFTHINLSTATGVTNDTLKQNVISSIGAGAYKVQTQKEYSDENRSGVGSFMDVIKYAMLGFAGIAFLVGIFLIINTFSMLVAQRTREIGLMRAIGSSRKQVNRSVLVEATLLGFFGSILGVGAGVGLAVGLMKLMSAAGMDLSTRDLTVKATTPVIGLVLGVVVTVLAAYLPARRAGKVSPMAALRDAGTPADGKAGLVRGIIGLVLTGAGTFALFTAAGADKASDGSLVLGAGVVLTLIGFVIIGPLLAGGVVRVISAVLLRFFGPVGRMAERNALRNPRRTGATGAALMIGLALVACLSVVGSSMVASATDELDKTVGTDFIIQGNQRIVPQAAKAIETTPGLEHVTHYRDIEAKIVAPDGSSDGDGVTAADPTYAQDLHRKTTAGELTAAYGKDSMSVGSKFATKHHVKLGDTLTVAFKGGSTAKLKVAAITDDNVAIDQGARYLSTETMRKYLPADRIPPDQIMFASAKNGQEKQAYAALKKSMEQYPQYQVRDQSDYKQELKDQIGQLLNMVYGLLALAIVVAVLGVINTLALSVVERTREIGLMRAIGMSRRQLRRMIRLESVVIALFGALLGLGLGMGWGATAQKLLALEGLKVLEIPWPTIIGVFIGSAFVGLFAALIPAFRAGRMNVLNAIATD
ncbi:MULTISPECIES: ABC transporter permease [Streptomyces]|uniref:FtsX-like permease family protein n=1 Tax=Streptomyces mirabilis TaxID=68239 RepID=A0ABU3US85_9ACTN|nr:MULTISPECIES: FtsX-like permease family protein [Streptomyces]MDU8996790.1 FtsX-like permease family protein [Streptomyces mirabilis]QDN88252.1 FtsX-like permease family protein [Streptomyces sp. RLB3-6]QDN98891.1 FtsX-like permease family protein [Streptomyces sp. RLB1-9]QDO09088.1 FtsX-like permease family protein [Streptomyces sp. S1D4-23]QDO20605.1 FtsX-like permease family protein [Streptomyces sp. S1A1-8]